MSRSSPGKCNVEYCAPHSDGGGKSGGSDSSTNVDIAPSNNAGMVVMQERPRSAFGRSDELQSELQTLAGPSAGPNGARSTSTDLPAARSRPRDPFAKFASTRIRFPPNTIGWVMAASKSSPTRPGSVSRPVFFEREHFCVQFTQPVRNHPGGNPAAWLQLQTIQRRNRRPLVSKKASFFFNIERRDIMNCQSSAPGSLIQRPSR